MFAEEFSDEMAKQFEEAMKSMAGGDTELVQQIEKLAAAAGGAGTQTIVWFTRSLFYVHGLFFTIG